MSAQKFHIQSLKLGEVKEVWFLNIFFKEQKIEKQMVFRTWLSKKVETDFVLTELP